MFGFRNRRARSHDKINFLTDTFFPPIAVDEKLIA